MKLRAFCPAKINLFLHITGKIGDYHAIQSVFRALDFGDILTLYPSQTLTLEGMNADGNLIIKAALALADYIQKPLTAHFVLDKKIAMGAGLGGGSSNAAAALALLNAHYRLHLSLPVLAKIGARVGADVPFFVMARAHKDAWVSGIGDKITPIALPAMRYLLLLPKAHHDTKAFFAHPGLKKDSPSVQNDFFHAQDKLAQIQHYHNAFLSVACQNPAVKSAYDYLNTRHPSARAQLSGTGSTVFLSIPNEVSTQTLIRWQQHAPTRAIIAHSLFDGAGFLQN